MIRLGHHGWTIRFCNDNFCWTNKKRIDINLSYSGDIRQIILHEIAHINTAKYCNQKHNLQFWKHLEFLTKKILKKELDKNQINHKKFMTSGFYDLYYEN